VGSIINLVFLIIKINNVKKHLLVKSFIIIAASAQLSAQQAIPLGRFLIGTNLVAFTVENQTVVTQYSNYSTYNNQEYIQTDSTHTTSNALKAHISLFVGYFVTKNICAGLQFGANSTGTYSTFIRYYFCQKKPDSTKFDFFIQANGTLSFSSTDNPYQIQTYPYAGYGSEASYSTSDYHNNQNTYDVGLGLAGAYHLTRHWALEAEAGFTYADGVVSTGAHDAITSYYSNMNNTAPPPVNQTTLPTKNKTITEEGFLRLMLSYRI
jgi:hypothetical protein